MLAQGQWVFSFSSGWGGHGTLACSRAGEEEDCRLGLWAQPCCGLCCGCCGGVWFSVQQVIVPGDYGLPPLLRSCMGCRKWGRLAVTGWWPRLELADPQAASYWRSMGTSFYGISRETCSWSHFLKGSGLDILPAFLVYFCDYLFEQKVHNVVSTHCCVHPVGRSCLHHLPCNAHSNLWSSCFCCAF